MKIPFLCLAGGLLVLSHGSLSADISFSPHPYAIKVEATDYTRQGVRFLGSNLGIIYMYPEKWEMESKDGGCAFHNKNIPSALFQITSAPFFGPPEFAEEDFPKIIDLVQKMVPPGGSVTEVAAPAIRPLSGRIFSSFQSLSVGVKFALNGQNLQMEVIFLNLTDYNAQVRFLTMAQASDFDRVRKEMVGSLEGWTWCFGEEEAQKLQTEDVRVIQGE